MQTMHVDRVRAISTAILDGLGKVYVGKRNTLTKMMAASFANGHVLFEDYPGLGKTLLAKLCSRIIGCNWSRVQFTPDLMPADILGTKICDYESFSAIAASSSRRLSRAIRAGLGSRPTISRIARHR